MCSVNCYQRDPAAVKNGSLFAQGRQRSFIDSSLFLFNLSGFPDPGWKVFYDSATPNSERMPDPWDAVSGLDRWVWTNHFPPCETQTVYKSNNIGFIVLKIVDISGIYMLSCVVAVTYQVARVLTHCFCLPGWWFYVAFGLIRLSLQFRYLYVCKVFVFVFSFDHCWVVFFRKLIGVYTKALTFGASKHPIS